MELSNDTVVQIAVQLWDIFGIPALLGIVTTWITQKIKLNPAIPLVEVGRTWIIRAFVAAVGTALQIAWFAIAGKEIGYELIQSVFLTYLASSVAYTHLFKTVKS